MPSSRKALAFVSPPFITSDGRRAEAEIFPCDATFISVEAVIPRQRCFARGYRIPALSPSGRNSDEVQSAAHKAMTSRLKASSADGEAILYGAYYRSPRRWPSSSPSRYAVISGVRLVNASSLMMGECSVFSWPIILSFGGFRSAMIIIGQWARSNGELVRHAPPCRDRWSRGGAVRWRQAEPTSREP